jgi:Ca2+-binding RTX toxin-like protein
VHSTAASYILAANVEHLTLDGTGDIAGTGNTLANTLTGNVGDNTLDGKTGADTMIGDAGNDTYVVDNIGDVVDESGGNPADVDTVNSSISFSLATLGALENLTLTGSAAISGTGNILANHIIGNAGANKLLGDAGNDTMEGGAGADTIDGGTGSNQITGGAGNDRIDVLNGDDTVFYNSKLDGKDVIDHFDGTATGGQDVLNLDALFDGLGVATADRGGRVSVVDSVTSVDVRVDADGKAGFELVVATLNTTDDITVGPDILVGSL